MGDILTSEELLSELQHLYEEDSTNNFMPESLLLAIKNQISNAKHTEDAANKLYKFAKSKREMKKLQIVEVEVPAGILQDGYSATLEDIRVLSRGPDDHIYSKNPDIRKWIPRGTTIMHLKGDVEWFDVVIYANKKFIGGIGDEDECQPEDGEEWRDYCLEDPDTANSVICMEKLNGEAAHFSGRYIDNNFYLITGSKNVHMLIRDCTDIDRYHGSRYGVAQVVAKTVCNTLKNLDDDKRHLLFNFLHHTKCTAFCEILQPENQHIVNLSELREPKISLIAFTSIATTDKETSLTALPPHHGLELSGHLGLSFTGYKIINPQEVLVRRKEIREKTDIEGEVLYFLNTNNDTIGLAKVKSTWYIILRALREKTVFSFTVAKKKSDWKLKDYIHLTHKRFLEIQKWLKFSDAYLQSWKKLSGSFLHWVDDKDRHNSLERSCIRPQFPKLWEQFLEEMDETDKIELK